MKNYIVNGHQVFSSENVDATRRHEGSFHTHAEAQVAAGAMMWADHLDEWLTKVEDEDLAESFAELFNLMPEDEEAHDADKIQEFYNKVEDRALAMLPMGLRLLADKYDREWLSHGIKPEGRHLRSI